jgi:hypothetical protein
MCHRPWRSTNTCCGSACLRETAADTQVLVEVAHAIDAPVRKGAWPLWMYTDPHRRVSGKNLYISIHADGDNPSFVEFKQLFIKTGKSTASIKDGVSSTGKLTRDRHSHTCQQVAQDEKRIVDALAMGMERLL